MNKSQLTVDKIENGLAVCETEEGLIDIPLAHIKGAVREGDILRAAENGAGYLVAKEETELRRAALQERFERLKAKNRRGFAD
jgi:hypothetical protein